MEIWHLHSSWFFPASPSLQAHKGCFILKTAEPQMLKMLVLLAAVAAEAAFCFNGDPCCKQATSTPSHPVAPSLKGHPGSRVLRAGGAEAGTGAGHAEAQARPLILSWLGLKGLGRTRHGDGGQLKQRETAGSIRPLPWTPLCSSGQEPLKTDSRTSCLVATLPLGASVLTPVE